MSAGFVAINRRVFDHEAFAPEPYTEREAWLWMIAEAAWEPCVRRVGTVDIELSRGQLAHSLGFMARCWKWDISRVRRFLNRLSARHMVDTMVKQKTTHLTICNYNVYQRGRHDGDTKNERKTTQTIRSKEISSEPKGSSDRRGTRLPEDWQPDELFAAREGLTVFEIRREAETFRDYWRQQVGAKGVKLDWQAAWRNWVRRCVKGRRTSSLPPQDRIPGFNKF